MATDFWASSHYKRWMVDRATVKEARIEDLQYVDDPDQLEFLAIYFANVISKLGKKLQLRQRAIATASVFFRRFYLKNSYCETDPFLVIAACCYVAAKAEESPVHIKNVIAESRTLFSQEQYNVEHFPSDHTRLAEMEFYLVDDLECDLTVFHPYRTLLALCRKDNSDVGSLFGPEEGEDGEVGTGLGVEDGTRYWGSGEGQLELAEGALQTAWFIVNDTYRSYLCLLHPPHIIAITALYLTIILHEPTCETVLPHLSLRQSSTTVQESTPTPQPRRSSRQAHQAATVETQKKTKDPITFLAELNVSLPLIATVAQEIISLYTLWDRYKEDLTPQGQSPFSGSGPPSPTKRSVRGHGSRSGSTPGPQSLVDTGGGGTGEHWNEDGYVTPAMLSAILLRMREARLADISHSASGRMVVVNKMLERTQAAG